MTDPSQSANEYPAFNEWYMNATAGSLSLFGAWQARAALAAQPQAEPTHSKGWKDAVAFFRAGNWLKEGAPVWDAPAPQAEPSSATVPSEREAFERHIQATEQRKPTLWSTVFANSLNRDPCPDHLKGVYFIKDEQKAWEAWQARAVLALAAPADEITNYVKGIYAYLESVAPTGLAAEAFRLPPSSTRAQAALFHSAAGHEHSECAGLARQDQGNRPADSEPVALAAPAVQAAPEWMLVLDNLLRYVEVNECEHDTTHRGGTIWTICDGCGKKWADDEGGFKPYQTPEVIEQARVLLADHTPPAEGKDAFWFMDDNPKPPAAQSADAVDALTDEQIIAIRNATWEGPAQPWGSALRFARAIEAAISQSAAAAKEAT